MSAPSVGKPVARTGRPGSESKLLQGPNTATVGYKSGLALWYEAPVRAGSADTERDNLPFRNFGSYLLGRGDRDGPMSAVQAPQASSPFPARVAGVSDRNQSLGQLRIRDLERQASVRVQSPDAIVLVIDRDACPGWLLRPALHEASIDGTLGLGRIVAECLDVITDEAWEVSVSDGVLAIEMLLRLAERGFTRPVEPSSTGEMDLPMTSLRSSAAQMIDENLLSADLSIESLVSNLGVSRSTLFRAFAATGGVLLHIRSARLERARLALIARSGHRPTVGEIAHMHGFVSESHFNRAFKKQFGIAPGSIVRAGMDLTK